MVVVLMRILAGITICFALWNIYVVRLLWTKKQCASTIATLIDVRSKKNVRVRERGVSGPFVTVPDSSTGIYRYSVEGRNYHLKGWQHIAPGKLPKQPRVVYWKRFPKYAYLDCELMFLPEILWAFMFLLTALCLWGVAQCLANGSIIW